MLHINVTVCPIKMSSLCHLRSALLLARTQLLRHASTKPNLNVGTIGHVDHGKTTLTAAITRVLSQRGQAKLVNFDEIDKGNEEKKRGITINLAHIGYESKTRRYAHTDCPGHSDFIKNMICGTAQMDVVILVVAATDGVMAQTKEHLLLATQIGVKHVIVFINKTDLVDDDVITLVEIETTELLLEHGFDESKVTFVHGSALDALENKKDECVDRLIEALDNISMPSRKEKEVLLMPIASRTPITGRGTVLVGTLLQGTLNKGDKLEVKGLGQTLSTVASDIQVFGKTLKQVTAGEHCGVLCRGVKPDSVHRGMWLGNIGAVTTSNLFKVELYLLSEQESGRRTAIRSGFSDKVYCTTWDQVGRFEFKQDLLMPGEHCSALVVFEKQMPALSSLPFTLREGNRTIARGVISKLLPPLQQNSFHTLKNIDLSSYAS